MSMWEFIMTMEGWKMANNFGGDAEGGAKPPTEDEFDAVMEQWNAENTGHG